MHNSVSERLSSPSYEKAPPFSPSADVFNIWLKNGSEIRSPVRDGNRAEMIAKIIDLACASIKDKGNQSTQKKAKKKVDVNKPESVAAPIQEPPIENKESLFQDIVMCFYKYFVNELNKKVKDTKKFHSNRDIVLHCVKDPQFSVLLNSIDAMLECSELNTKNKLIFVNSYLFPYFFRFNDEIINVFSGIVKTNHFASIDTLLPTVVLPKLNFPGPDFWQFMKDKLMKYHQLGSPDLRKILNQDRQLRRLDSLSKLLSPDSRYTPCVAVTIDGIELIVSCNLNSNANAEELVLVMEKKLSIIHEYFREMNLDNEQQMLLKPEVEAVSLVALTKTNGALELQDLELILDSKCYQKTMELVENLKSNGGIFQPVHVLFQAAIKVLTALRTQESFFSSPKLLNLELLSPSSCTNLQSLVENEAEYPIFSDDYRRAILGHSATTIVVPFKSPDQPELGMLIKKSNERSNLQESVVTFPFLPQVCKINHLHAEQLSSYYILVVKKKTLTRHSPKIRVGVSKLCCLDCTHELSLYTPFIFSGTSGVHFQDTAALLSPKMLSAIILQRGAAVSATADVDDDDSVIDEAFDAWGDDFTSYVTTEVGWPDAWNEAWAEVSACISLSSELSALSPGKKSEGDLPETPNLKHNTLARTCGNPSPFFSAEKGDGDSKTTRGRHFSPKSLFFN